MNTRKEVSYSDNLYTFECPHCSLPIQVEKQQVNCQIFVHGQFKTNGEQVNPHASQSYCESLLNQDLVYGCCKPFKMFFGKGNTIEYVDIWNYG